MAWNDLRQNPPALALAAVALSAGILGLLYDSSVLLAVSLVACVALLVYLASPKPLGTPKLAREHGPVPAMATIYQYTRPDAPADLAHTETDTAGLEGEEKARQALTLLPAAYYVVFDAPLPQNGDSVDAIVIGPTGVYVVAMVNWRGTFSLKNGHWFRMNGDEPVAIMAANPFVQLGDAVPFVEATISRVVGQTFSAWQDAQQTLQRARFGQTYSIVNGIALLSHPDSRLTTDHTGYPTLRLPDLLHGIHEGYAIVPPDVCAGLFRALTTE